MLKIVLKIDDKDKTFVQDFISARMLKDTIEATKVISKKELFEEELDFIANYLVKLYGNQFTFDELLDGIASNKFVAKAIEDMNITLGIVTEKAGSEGKN